MVSYIFLRGITALFSVLSFKTMYRVADFFVWLLYYVIGYRKKVVFQQLHQSFPDKSEQEIRSIAKSTYKNLGDIFAETLKGFTMNQDDFKERCVFINPEVINQYTHDGKTVILMTAHYNNWEWACITAPMVLSAPVIGFYKPLSNQRLDTFIKAMRAQVGLVLEPSTMTPRVISRHRGKATSFIFISDQSTWSDKAYWTTFLGQDTACPPGADRYAKILDAPVVYMHIYRKERGYYEIRFETITNGEAPIQDGDITKQYMDLLEKDILSSPGNWLWTHKRWKKKRHQADQIDKEG